MEILGVVTGGLALADSAARMAHTCLKLYELWEAMNDAPVEVRSLLGDLHLVGRILHDISAEKDLAPSVEAILTSCLRKLEDLEQVVRDLDDGLSASTTRKRMYTGFKFIGKSKQLQKLHSMLSDCKQTLALGLIHQSLQRPKVTVTNNEINAISIGTTLSPEERPRQPVLTKQSAEITNPSPDDPPPAYSPRKAPGAFPHEPPASSKPPVTELAAKTEKSSTAAIVSSKAVQAFLQHSMHMAVDNLFATGTVQQLMDSTLNQVTSFETSASGTYTADGYEVSQGTQGHDGVPRDRSEHRRPSLSRSRTCHQTSSMGVLLGSVWVRTSTLKVEDDANPASGKMEVITSFIFYPASWLSRIGLGYGTEASLNYSATGGWRFNMTPVRAVPDSALIFDLCRKGEVGAVELLLNRGDASVKDTSPSGWSPLHFAAANGHIELCEALINAGADKSALVYKGPTQDALTPATIFAESCQSLPAHEKIRMLRLFADTLDLTDPTGDGWVVITSLVKSLNKESVPMTDISVNWLLRLTSSEHVVAFGARSIWDGLQHAVRAFLFHEEHSQVLQHLLQTGNSNSGVSNKAPGEMDSQMAAVARWLALRASQRDLLPMVVEAGRFLKMDGYDWVRDGITPKEYCRALPAIYAAWTKALPSGIERYKDLLEDELEDVLKALSMDRELLRRAIQDGEEEANAAEAKPNQVCSDCGDSYVKLGTGLVQPCLIAFAECRKTDHRKDCECEEFIRQSGVDVADGMIADSLAEETVETADGEGSESEVDEDFCMDGGDSAAAGSGLDELCRVYDEKMRLRDDDNSATDPFCDAATLLYRAQARRWLGSYGPEEMLCATCFLRREQYLGADGQWTEHDATPMPPTYGAFAAPYAPSSTVST